MKVSIKLIVATMLIFSLAACNQKSSNQKNLDKTQTSDASALKSGEESTINTLMDEGKITISITTPENPLGELLQKVDPAKGDVQGQLKVLGESLSKEDKTKLENQNKNLGLMNLAILLMPPKGVIYVKGGEATAKFDGLTYHGENTVNESKQTGMIYLKSQNSSKAVTVSYTGDSFEEMTTNDLKVSDYDIIKTDEVSIVAGFPCSKSIYTIKDAAAPKKSAYGLPSAIFRLEVWTAKQMPKVVNFFHPLYINEDAGIMKILIQYQKESDLKFLYEFTSVERRPVTAAEMTIRKTDKISDFGKDKMKIGMEMMGIMLGM